MRTTLAVLTVAAGVAVGCQSASAIPVAATVIKDTVTTTSAVQQVQYRERRTRHGVVKCYRDLMVGPYRCHYYRNW